MKRRLTTRLALLLVAAAAWTGLTPAVGMAGVDGPWVIIGHYTGPTDGIAYERCFDAGARLISTNPTYEDFRCTRDAPRLYRLWADLSRP